MKVLVTGMGWQGEQPGGLNRYAIELCDALKTNGVAVEAVVIGSTEPSSGFVGTAPLGASLPRRILSMAVTGRAKGRTVDVINTHFALYAWPVLLAGPRKPVVTHFQGPWYREVAAEGGQVGIVNAIRKLIEASVYRRADEVITLSEEFRRLLLDDFGLFPSRVHVISPGVDLDRFIIRDREKVRSHLGLEARSLTVLAVRRLARRMGLDILIRAWAEATLGDAVLCLVGDGPERDYLECLARELGVASSVRFAGRVEEEELALWYSAADCSVVPSVALEGFGLVVLESLACGTPVIATAIGGMAEILEGFSPSSLLPPGDVSALAGKLANLACGVERLPTAEDCRTFACQFSWATVAGRVVRVYEHARLEPPRRPYRVVFVDHCARLSGGELALLRLLKADHRIEPYVILGEDGPLRERLLSAGIECEVIPFYARDLKRDRVLRLSGILFGTSSTVLYAVRLARRLRYLRPDLIHTNSLKAGVFGSLAGRATRTPVVWHLHDLVDRAAFGRLLSYCLGKAVRHLPAAVIANSSATAATVGKGKAPLYVVPSPVDAIRPEPAQPKADTVVGIVGRLAPWKGQHVFIDAIAKLADEYPDVRGRIIGSALFGEEEYAAELKERAQVLGIFDKVEFVGFREDIAAELSALSVAVHASVLPEPFGQVIIEAMACGIPVVAANAGGPVEIITDGVDGLLVPSGDADELARAISRLLADTNLATELTRAGLMTARRYRPDQVVLEFEEVYRAVLAKRGGGRVRLTASR